MNKNRSGKFHRRSPMARRVTPVLNDVRTNSTEYVLGNYGCKSCPKALHTETGSKASNSSVTRIIAAWPLLQPHVRETILTLVDAVARIEWIAACDNPCDSCAPT